MTGAIDRREGGEFAEIVKKCISANLLMMTQSHIKPELGDIMWYWISACRAMDLDPNDVVVENVNKLKQGIPAVSLRYFIQK